MGPKESPFAGGPPGGVLSAPLSTPPVSEPSGSDAATSMAPARSVQSTEAQLMGRCMQAVQACRSGLAELRVACKAATSHREKCAELLGAGTAAVGAVEDTLYDPHIDLAKERKLQQLAGRVQNAMDQGEAVVKVYGSKSGFLAIASKMCSPGTPLKFDAVIADLTNLAKQARLVRVEPPILPAGRMLSASTAAESVQLAGSAPTEQGSQAASQMAPVASGSVAAPRSPSPTVGGGAPSMAPAPSSAMTDQGSVAGPAASGPAAGMTAMWVAQRGSLQEGELQQTKIRKGGKAQQVPAMVYVPPASDQPGHLGSLWYFYSKPFGSSGLVVYDLSARVDTEVKEARQDPSITCMHYDDVNNCIWTGHQRGYIRVWSAQRQEALCAAFRVFRSAVTCITSDEHGFCWAGSDTGRVKCVKTVSEEVNGLSAGFCLKERGELLWAGDGIKQSHLVGELKATEEGFMTHGLFKEPAHYGPVRCIAAAEGRVWTSGGSAAFARFHEWTQTGFLPENSSHNMKKLGLASDIVITTQLVVVNEAQKVLGQPGSGSQGMASALSSFTAAGPGGSVASRQPVSQTQLVEMEMPWQVLTAHDGGYIQVWGPVTNKLHPLLRLGGRCAPPVHMAVCEPLGALVTAHSDGTLQVWSLPHPRRPGGLTVNFNRKDLSLVSTANMPTAVFKMSSSGLANLVGGVVGIITASNSGAIKHMGVDELRLNAEEKGIVLLGPVLSATPEQWPVVRLTSFGVRDWMDKWVESMESQYGSREIMAELQDLPGSDAQERTMPLSLVEGGPDMLIDWKDLQCSKIIGEGAFGKVWLGRWQETDVAIKQLGSLSALGVPMGSLQHDPSGDVKMDKEVQKALHKEVELLHRMRHPNTILFMGVVLDPPAVVTEYCARGSLYDLLKETTNRPALVKALDWSRRIVMALDAAKGMLYLHGHKPQPIIHRDLKSPNLLVTKDWRVKVTDFNLSKSQSADANAVNSVQSLVANNPRWQPPEVITAQKYSKASDVYAYGLILWELLTWQLPFSDLTPFQIIIAVTQQGKRPPVLDATAAGQYLGGTFVGYDEYVALMNRCWATEPAERPTFDEIITDLRKIAQILTDARPSRGSGPALLPSHSRNLARLAPQLARAPSSGRQAAPQPGAAALPAPAQPQAGAAVAAAGDRPVDGARPLVDSAYAVDGPGHQQEPSPPAGPQQVQESPMVVSSNSAMLAGPFGGGPAPWLQQGAAASAAGQPISSAAPPPPSPFGDAPIAGQTISSAAPPPPSPFGGGAPFAGQTISSAAPPPPSPFGGGPIAGQPISSAAPPPPSPFGDAPIAGQTISSAAPPPPSPFGGGAPFAGQTISSTAPPPPSPFGGGPIAGQTISSAAPPPPSPFGSAAVMLNGSQTVSSASALPPSPFGTSSAVQLGQGVRSSSPPPPSPFSGRLSPYAAHFPSDSPPPEPPLDTSSVPSTVLEASESVEAAAAAADVEGNQWPAPQPAAAVDGALVGYTSGNSRRDSQLVDSAVSVMSSGGHMPARGTASGALPGPRAAFGATGAGHQLLPPGKSADLAPLATPPRYEADASPSASAAKPGFLKKLRQSFSGKRLLSRSNTT